MPFTWVEPEEFLTAAETGVCNVYYCVKGQCVTEYHYQVDHPELGWYGFDVRELRAELLEQGVEFRTDGPDLREQHKNIIAAAQDSKLDLLAWVAENGYYPDDI